MAKDCPLCAVRAWVNRACRLPRNTYERGENAANVALLTELHPTYPCSIQLAYDGGVMNPYRWWQPVRRWLWQRGFRDYYRKEQWRTER